MPKSLIGFGFMGRTKSGVYTRSQPAPCATRAGAQLCAQIGRVLCCSDYKVGRSLFISTWNYFITWTVSATFVESRPGSTADAISLYAPGAVNVAVVIAGPLY